MMDRSEAPAIAALVAWPARSEWPAYLAGSSPARFASFFTIRAMSIACQPAGPYLPMAIDRTEHRPAGDARLFNPGLQVANWAGLGIRSVRDAHLAPSALLIGFAPAEHDGEAILSKGAIRQVQRHEFRSAKCTRESEEDQRAIPQANQPTSVAAAMARTSSVRAGAFWTGAVPKVRRMPFMVFATRELCVGEPNPAAL